MDKNKIKVLAVDRPLRAEEHSESDVFLKYKGKYDIVVFGKEAAEVAILNTTLWDIEQWDSLFKTLTSSNKSDAFYWYDMRDFSDKSIYNVLEEKFEFEVVNLTDAENNNSIQTIEAVIQAQKYYGFNFKGEGKTEELVQTTHIVGNKITVKDLEHSAKDCVGKLKFKALFCIIKELTVENTEVKKQSSAKVGSERFQAFIFLRKGDMLTEDTHYCVKNRITEKKLDMALGFYNITIIKLDEQSD